MNQGKIFEDDFKKSVPEYALLYRLSDDAQSFGDSKKLRFSHKKPFDFQIWNPKTRTLYALELKTVSGKAISFERTKEDKGEIHYHQIEGLNKWNQYDGTVCGFIIKFRELETTVFIDIGDFNTLIGKIAKKSFNYKDLVDSSLPYLIIPQQKKRVRYTYDIDYFLSQRN